MIILFFLSLLVQVFPLNSTLAPIWVTSDYFRAGNQNVISNLTGSSAVPAPTYTFTFTSPLSGVPELGYGIKNY